MRLGQAAGLLSRHHSRQQPVDMGYWICKCKSWSWDAMPKCYGCGNAKPIQSPCGDASTSPMATRTSYADVVRRGRVPKTICAKSAPQAPPDGCPAPQRKKRSKAAGGFVSAHTAALATLRGDGDPATVALVSQLEEALKEARIRRLDDKPIPQRISELEKRRSHKVQTSKRADDFVADCEEKLAILLGQLDEAKVAAAARKDELATIDASIAECRSVALAKAGTVNVEACGVEVPAAASIINTLFSPDVGCLLMADPVLQALLVASNEATRNLVSQFKEAASKLAPSTDAETVTVPLPAPAKSRWSDSVPIFDDVTMDDDDEKKVLACLWPEADTSSGESCESLKKKLANLENKGYTVISKRRKSGQHG